MVVLGGGVSADGELNHWSRSRLEVGLDLMEREVALYLILSGGWALTEPRPPRTEAEVMAERAAERIDPGRIRTESRSRDTIGNAWFTRQILEEEGWSRVCGVTSDFHVARAAWIFSRVLPDVVTTWVPAPSGLEGAARLSTLTQEVALRTFVRQWIGGIEPGDEEALRRFIRHEHPGYADEPTQGLAEIRRRIRGIRDRLG